MSTDPSMPRYGHISYELPRALVLVEAIGDAGGLQLGGEQYPNGLCCDESAAALARCLARGEADGWGDECTSAIRGLGEMLAVAGRYGYVQTGSDEVPSPQCPRLADLKGLAETVQLTMPQAWTIAPGPHRP